MNPSVRIAECVPPRRSAVSVVLSHDDGSERFDLALFDPPPFGWSRRDIILVTDGTVRVVPGTQMSAQTDPDALTPSPDAYPDAIATVLIDGGMACIRNRSITLLASPESETP